MTNTTQDIQELTADALDRVPQPWPDYISFLIFLAIEHNPDLLQRFQALVDKYTEVCGSKDAGKGHVNNTIGKSVKKLSGLQTLSSDHMAKSKLIKSYSKLG